MTSRVCALLSKVVLLLIFNAAAGQGLKPHLYIETGLYSGTGENTSFLLLSNRYGVLRNEKNGILIRPGFSGISDTSRNLSFAYGMEAAYRYDSDNRLWLQQGYGKIILSSFALQAGLAEDNSGNQDRSLSSGGYLFSDNARPIPKISLHTNDYIYIPFTGQLLELNAGISHGWFGEKEQYVKHAYLHYKYAFLRIGESKWRISVDIGIQHAAMWGGVSPDSGRLPSDLKAFRNVFFARMAGDLGPYHDRVNVLGNHLGSYSLGVKYKTDNYIFDFYWQTFLEDKNGRVGKDWKNKSDGLWGITLSKKYEADRLAKILFEFFKSTNQSGDPYQSGNDNYFNNYLYKSGWTWHEMTIGTPLITSPVLTEKRPEEENYIENNSLKAFIAGIQYLNYQREYTTKFIYSLNYGTVSIPYPSVKRQFSALIRYTYSSTRYSGLTFSWEAAIDIGSHLGNNAGIMLNVRKTF